MSHQAVGIIIGGIIPAFLFAFSTLFGKAGIQVGIGTGYYIVFVGAATVITGIVFLFIIPDTTLSVRSALLLFASGAMYAIGIGCVAFALIKYSAPLSQLIPLYNMNTLIGVLLALWIFAEWKQVHVPKLLIGSMLIVIGGILVARS